MQNTECQRKRKVHTGDGFGDNGGMVVGVVTRVEEMVVQGSVEPVVEELHRAHVQQSYDHCSFLSPHRDVAYTRNKSVHQVEQDAIEYDLIIPAIYIYIH